MATSVMSAEQLVGISDIKQMMSELGLDLSEVKEYYRVHAPAKAKTRRAMTIAQRLALNQIKILIRRFKVTAEELDVIFKEVESSNHQAVEQVFEVVEEMAPQPAASIVEDPEKKAKDALAVALTEMEAKRSGSGVVQTPVTLVERVRQPGQPMRQGDKGWVKYRHPDTKETWDGSGGTPGWLQKALLVDGMLLRDLLPIENFPLPEEIAGLPPGVPFEELEGRFNLKQGLKCDRPAEVHQD